MLLAGLSPILAELSALAKVVRVQMELGDSNKVRAAACGLLVEAAKQTGTPEALTAVAERLLELAARVQVKPNGKSSLKEVQVPQ